MELPITPTINLVNKDIKHLALNHQQQLVINLTVQGTKKINEILVNELLYLPNKAVVGNKERSPYPNGLTVVVTGDGYELTFGNLFTLEVPCQHGELSDINVGEVRQALETFRESHQLLTITLGYNPFPKSSNALEVANSESQLKA